MQKGRETAWKDWKSVEVREIIIFKNTVDNKALRGNSAQTLPHEGSTAGSCVSAIVLGNFLYIYNI
jgi:hypothetical protein